MTLIQYPQAKPPASRQKSKPGRKSDAERLERKLELERLQRVASYEAKRAQPVMPDTKQSLGIALSLAGVALLTSFVVSYSTLVAVAEWMRLEWSALNWIVPGFIEVVIVFSIYDYIISRSRRKSGRVPFWFMIGASVIAVVGNAAHTYAEWEADGAFPWQGVIGTVLSGMVPLIVAYISKRLSVLVFAEPEH